MPRSWWFGRLSGLQAGGSYDSVEIVGRPPSWVDVFAVFSVKTVSGDGVDVVICCVVLMVFLAERSAVLIA